MAQSIKEIYDVIVTEKQKYRELDELNSDSQTAIWRLWAYVTATTLYYQQVLFDNFKVEITTIAEQKQYGTLTWWAAKVREYQHGGLLQFINYVYQYATVDATKRPVVFISVTDERGFVNIKVAGSDNNLQAAPLSSDIVNGLQDYCEELRPAGVRCRVDSLPADLLKLRLNIYYDAQADLPTVKQSVETAINNYIRNLQFDATFYINGLIDAIQSVPGIINEQVQVLEAAAKNGSDPYEVFTSKYRAKSGYFKIDPGASLSNNITYIT